MIALKNVLSRLTTKKEGDIEVVNVIPEDGNEIYLPQTGDLLDMEKQYRQIMFFYEAGIQQVTAKLEILNKEFQYCNDRNPIENIKSRVKSADSIIEKMKKKGLPLTISCMMGNIHDIAGVARDLPIYNRCIPCSGDADESDGCRSYPRERLHRTSESQWISKSACDRYGGRFLLG